MNRTFCVVASIVACSFAGCGGAGDEGGVPVYPVSGAVTMFNKPLSGATIIFAPEGDQPTATGTTDAEGKYQLTTYEFGDGAAEGSYRVIVSKSVAASAAGGATTVSEDGLEHAADAAAGTHGSSSPAATSTSMVPPQFSSSTETPLSANVKVTGENTFDFEIK